MLESHPVLAADQAIASEPPRTTSLPEQSPDAFAFILLPPRRCSKELAEAVRSAGGLAWPRSESCWHSRVVDLPGF